MMPSEETMDLLSSVRLGINLGLLEEITIPTVNELFIQTQPAHLQKLMGASLDGGLVGTVQLHPAGQANGSHRAEVAKLLVHRSARRRGVGRALMGAVEALAREQGRTLLVLDTQTGSDAERLYTDLGWTVAGVIPGYSRLSDGSLGATTYLYKRLEP